MTSLTFALSRSGFSWTTAEGNMMSFWPQPPPAHPHHTHININSSAGARAHLLTRRLNLTKPHLIEQSAATANEAQLFCRSS